MRSPRSGPQYLIVLATLAIAMLVPLSVAAASSHHRRVVPLPHFHPVTKVVKLRHKRWLVLKSLTITHLGHIRPYVECGGCLREPGRIRTSKFKHGKITYSGVNWLLRGKFAAAIVVYRKGRIGRFVLLRARLGKHPALVFERAVCLRSRTRTTKCPKRVVAPVAGSPVSSTPAATPTAPSPPTIAAPPSAPPPTGSSTIGTPTANATASGNNVTFTGSVDANGSSISVSVTDTTDGATRSCGSGSGVVQCTWVEAGLKYKTAYAYTLTATDTSGSGRPTVSAQASVTTGAPPAIQTPEISGSVSGTTIDVTGSVNAGGLPATVVLRDNTDGAVGSCTASSVSYSCNLREVGLNYLTTYSYTVTATDASGNGRATTSASWAGTTETPPSPPSPPSVSVSRGSAAPTSRCGGASSCYYIQTTTANFPASVSCQITASTYGLAGFITWTQGANATNDGPDAQQNQSVTVQCTGGGQTASGTGNW